MSKNPRLAYAKQSRTASQQSLWKITRAPNPIPAHPPGGRLLLILLSICKIPHAVELQGFEPAKHCFARPTPAHHITISILNK